MSTLDIECTLTLALPRGLNWFIVIEAARILISWLFLKVIW
jgi:hypothetical protein